MNHDLSSATSPPRQSVVASEGRTSAPRSMTPSRVTSVPQPSHPSLMLFSLSSLRCFVASLPRWKQRFSSSPLPSQASFPCARVVMWHTKRRAKVLHGFPDNGQWTMVKGEALVTRAQNPCPRSHLHCRYFVDPLVVSHVSYDHSNLTHNWKTHSTNKI